jgi:hypothetical protein
MLRKSKIYALARLLRERFGGKMSRGLALVSSRRRECPDVRNFFLNRFSPHAARVVKPSPLWPTGEEGLIPLRGWTI